MDHPAGANPSSIGTADVSGVASHRVESIQARSSGADDALAFGAYTLLTGRRRLERDGAPVPLGDKAFEVLKALVENAGQVVGKADLLRQAGVSGEDSLRFHISSLRKALGEGRYIASIAGQGYSFVAPVSRVSRVARAEAKPPARPLPGRPRRLVGRDPALTAIADHLFEHRFVTVVGPGGVGKTSVALTLAHELAARFEGDVCFFDVASVFNPDLLAGALASALGVPMQPAGAAPGLVAFLQRRRMLLVLDGCEPGVEAAATLAEQLTREAPQVHLLATSREALRADGEHVYRLFPLDYPPAGAGQTASDALAFAAVQLFMERVGLSQRGFALTDDEAPVVSEICRKLDGLALAIELAAGRVDAYGVREVARQLESQFALIWPGRRTAVARHQTLNATLGWSHQLLSDHEQIVFRRLSIFAGAFTLDMATAAVADETMPGGETIELLGSLVSKSLVQFNVDGAGGAYRLLDTTRSYALDRLAEAGEARAMAERHAGLVRRLLEEGATSAPNDGLRLRELLDDVSAAIEWSLSPDGDLDTAAALAVGSAPVWLQAGVLMECRFWMRRVLDGVPAPILGAQRQVAIEAALASAETFTDGFSDDSFASWQSAFATARSLGSIQQQLTCLVVLWAHRIRAPRYPDALALAEQMAALAAPLPDPGARAIADWMGGITHHHVGRLATARPLLEQSLAADTLEARQAMMIQFGYDRRIPTLGVLSNLHWLEGRPDEAVRLGGAALAEARESAYPVPLCEALTWQALNLHLRGDDPGQVEALADETMAHARPHFIESYVGLGMALKGLNAAAQGDADGASLVAQGLELLAKSRYEVFHPLFLTELARVRAEAGAPPGAEQMADLLALDGRGSEQWSSAEVKRNLGEVLLHRGEPGRAAELFAAAAACAERQGAVGWALRAALSLARSATDPRARRAARERLAGVAQRLTGGEGTADLRAATRLLSSERV